MEKPPDTGYPHRVRATRRSRRQILALATVLLAGCVDDGVQEVHARRPIRDWQDEGGFCLSGDGYCDEDLLWCSADTDCGAGDECEPGYCEIGDGYCDAYLDCCLADPDCQGGQGDCDDGYCVPGDTYCDEDMACCAYDEDCGDDGAWSDCEPGYCVSGDGYCDEGITCCPSDDDCGDQGGVCYCGDDCDFYGDCCEDCSGGGEEWEDCPGGGFRCRLRWTEEYVCIPSEQVCDCYVDCDDPSDEEGCADVCDP